MNHIKYNTDGSFSTLIQNEYISDDRIKNAEVEITNGLSLISQLRPEIYNKYTNFDCSGDYIVESGLIAQEVWNIEDLRHLVKIPIDASGNLLTTPSVNPENDPNYYPNWGNTLCSLNYTGLIPFLISSIKELKTRIEVLENT